MRPQAPHHSGEAEGEQKGREGEQQPGAGVAQQLEQAQFSQVRPRDHDEAGHQQRDRSEGHRGAPPGLATLGQPDRGKADQSKTDDAKGIQ